MKKYIIMSILTQLLGVLGCMSNEDKFIKQNKVIYYGTSEFTEFQSHAIIKIDSAWKIQKKYAEENNKIPENWLFFIVNDSYVFNSSINPKEAKTFIGGIWINSKTGKSTFNNSKVRLKYKKAYNGDGQKFPF
jgi:hypothetical protein